ncbi:MAG: hypothetical protein A3J76_04445 [Candidatus Moranbacteria bacterium RBG_13_45_13]|nr:MAG: hypothetical protein A3J76_04445 [Candidatus Moranbacteria bacterium RBG_13_45_13]
MLCHWEKFPKIKKRRERMQPTKDLKILKHKVKYEGQDCQLHLELGGEEVEQQTKVTMTLHNAKEVEVSSHGQDLTFVNAEDGAPVVLMFAAPTGFFM